MVGIVEIHDSIYLLNPALSVKSYKMIANLNIKECYLCERFIIFEK